MALDIEHTEVQLHVIIQLIMPHLSCVFLFIIKTLTFTSLETCLKEKCILMQN